VVEVVVETVGVVVHAPFMALGFAWGIVSTGFRTGLNAYFDMLEWM